MDLLEMLQQIGINPKRVATTHGGEYHSPCPSCGGTNRLFSNPYKKMAKCTGSYSCRQCGIYGDSIEFARKFLHCSFSQAVELVTGIITLPNAPIQSSYKNIQTSHATLSYPPAQWVEHATDFVEQAHNNLLKIDEILTYLAHRGIPLQAVINAKIGWNSEVKYLKRMDWGLPEQQEENKNSKNVLWIPEGLVIPIFDVDRVIRLKVRRSHWNKNDKLPKYVAISGSMNGLNIIGSQKHTTMVIVESELDAYAVHHATGDFICAVAVGSNIKNPDNITDYLARKATQLLICHDNDIAGQTMLNKWKKLYPHAISYPTPIGKDIGEAVTEGLDLRAWLLQYP